MEAQETVDAPPDVPAGDPIPEIVLDGRFRVFPDQPLPGLDVPGARAFVAEDSKDTSRTLFARVCEPGLYPRSDIMERIRSLRDSHVMRPVRWGPAGWTDGKTGRFVTFFDRPPEGPLMPSVAARVAPMSPDEICRTILAPAVRTLKQLAQRGLTHRAIRPDNIFSVSGEAGICFLGECVSTPAAWGQPAVVEPIPLIMCDRAGKGSGWIGDDLYALGATMLILALGRNPARHLDDAALLQSKMEHGSYAAILNGERAPQRLREPLRALLADDARERWAFEDLDRWLSGAPRRSVQPARELRSDRSLTFSGKEFRGCRPLAHAFAGDWEEAAVTIRSGAFESWLKRGIGDAILSDLADEVIRAASTDRRTPIGDDVLVSRICMLLDSAAPLRFRGRNLMPDGVGTALTLAYERNEADEVELLVACVSSGLMGQWFANQRRDGRYESDADQRLFERLPTLVKRAAPGFGVERCLYELNRNVPCMSEILGDRRLVDLNDLLPALEDIVRAKGGLTALIDRHLPAFIAAHITKTLDQNLAHIASATGDSPTAKLGMLHLLGTVQDTSGPDELVHLTEWMARELQSLAVAFHSRTHRDKVAKQLQRVVQNGNLTRLYQHLDNGKLRRQDEQGYATAIRRYAQAREQIDQLGSEEHAKSIIQLGHSVAAGVSFLVAAAAVVAVTLF